MIGHYVNNLTAEQEDRVLTGTMVPQVFTYNTGDSACLVGRAEGVVMPSGMIMSFDPRYECYDLGSVRVAHRYDLLCESFGTGRVNNLIRERILANRAARALSGVRELVETR